jgi:transposase
MARLADGPAASEHRSRVPSALGVGRHLGAAAPCAVRAGAGTGGQRGEPERRDHRQSERQERGKGGTGIDPAGYDAGKKVKGKKRHILVDTLGLILAAHVHPASIQDRDGALPLLKEARRLFPFIERIFADGAYQGATTAAAVRALGAWEIEIVKRSDQAQGFAVLPKRWIVERTFGWLGRCRRLAKDFENRTRTALAFLRLALIRLMLRRIARASAQT